MKTYEDSPYKPLNCINIVVLWSQCKNKDDSVIGFSVQSIYP